MFHSSQQSNITETTTVDEKILVFYPYVLIFITNTFAIFYCFSSKIFVHNIKIESSRQIYLIFSLFPGIFMWLGIRVTPILKWNFQKCSACLSPFEVNKEKWGRAYASVRGVLGIQAFIFVFVPEICKPTSACFWNQ